MMLTVQTMISEAEVTNGSNQSRYQGKTQVRREVKLPLARQTQQETIEVSLFSARLRSQTRPAPPVRPTSEDELRQRVLQKVDH